LFWRESSKVGLLQVSESEFGRIAYLLLEEQSRRPAQEVDLFFFVLHLLLSYNQRLISKSMDDVRAEFQDEQPDEGDEEYHQVEPKSRRAANFIDDDEFSGENVDLTQRPQTYANMAYTERLPPLPGNLQKIKDIFDMLQTQKQMVAARHSEKIKQSKEKNRENRSAS
jgi:hypothetical protein